MSVVLPEQSGGLVQHHGLLSGVAPADIRGMAGHTAICALESCPMVLTAPFELLAEPRCKVESNHQGLTALPTRACTRPADKRGTWVR